MSRKFLRQNFFELPDNIPSAKRKGALDLLVRKWSPFAVTAYTTQWAGHRASVYAWDRDQANADVAAAGYNPKRCMVCPETFIREPISDGFRLATMADGFEGQVWRQGLLTTTRWWESIPSARDWSMYLRAAGLDLNQTAVDRPAPVDSPLLATPWAVTGTPVTAAWAFVQTERAAAIAAVVVAAPFLYLFGQAAALSSATAAAESTMAEMAETNQTVRVDRSTALDNLDTIESYLSLEPFPPQFEIIAAASNFLRDRNLTIAEWVYDNGNLELTIASPAPLDSTFYIETFEKDGHFSDVSGTSGVQQKTLRLSMRITPQVWPIQ